MEDAPETRKQNNNDINRSLEWRAQKDKVAEEKGLDDAEYEFIECIIDQHVIPELNVCIDFLPPLRFIFTTGRGSFTGLLAKISLL